MVSKYWMRSLMESLSSCRAFHQGKELDWLDTFEMPATSGRDDSTHPESYTDLFKAERGSGCG